jgi:hypothetical protein
MTIPPPHPSDYCPECGAVVFGGRAGCQQLFDDVLAREYADYRYARDHRLTVDAYALQHPDEYMRSAKSYAAHLTGAYLAIERGFAAETNRAVQQWLSGARTLQCPDPPSSWQRGTLTVAHVHAASDPEAHLQRVREWAESAWAAWRGYRDIARGWTEEAIRGHPARSRG